MAGFIVPEGIIFQNSGDYVELRKWLVNGAGLWAVISLPAHVFQPYSGVKTSILFIDRNVARWRDEIILVKVENDGYTLNTNRAATARNDLPEALNLLTIGKKSLEELRGYLEQNCGKQDMPQALVKPRSEFARLDAYKAQSAAFSQIRKQYEKCMALEEEMSLLPPPGRKGLGEKDKKTRTRLQGNLTKQASEFSKITGTAYTKIQGGGDGVSPIQFYFDGNLKEAVIAYGADSTMFGGLSTYLRDYLDGQRVYNLSFDKYAGGETQEKSSGFMMVTLGDSKYFRIESGGTPKSEQPEFWNGTVDWVTLVDLPSGNFITEIVSTRRTITESGLNSSSAKLLPPDSVLVSSRATIGRIGINKVELATNQGFKNIVINDKNSVDANYVAYILTALVPEMEQLGSGATYKEVSKQQFSTLQIPLPPLEIQKQIVAEIEAYQNDVKEAKQRILDAEANIRATISRVWGE